MEIFLMRHGETDWNLSKRIQGTKPVPLNATGVCQIQRFCQNFKDKKGFRFTRIISSPLIRAVQSARICSELLNLPFDILDDFRERSFGKLEGKTHKEIESQFHVFDVEEIENFIYGIEPISVLDERLATGLRFLKSTYSDDRILVITHGSIIRRIGQINGQNYGVISNGSFVQLRVE